MNLEAWLGQDHSLPDQLKVIEGLCSALNDAHARGTVHRGLEPARIEVQSDGTCDLSDAVTAAPSGRYRAPEIAEGGPPSPQSDIYSAGVIFYEMLGGRPPSGDRPSPLADLRPDVSRDLTDAVMGCLEKGPDWRPKDLSYLLQVVATLRASGTKGAGRAARSAEPRASAAKSAPAPARRSGSRGGSRSNLPLVAAVLVLAAGGGAGYWMYSKQGAAVPATVPTPPPPVLTPPPTVVAVGSPTPAPAVGTPKAAESNKPTPAPTKEPAPVAATATPTPRPVAVATPAPQVAQATPPPAVAATPAPTPPPASAPAEPTLLTAVSPPTVHRGAQTMLDIRGTGFRADQQARIVRVKEDASGITVVRQKFVDATLIKVLVNLDARVPAGAYALALADGSGALTNTVSFTVAK